LRKALDLSFFPDFIKRRFYTYDYSYTQASFKFTLCVFCAQLDFYVVALTVFTLLPIINLFR